MIQGKDRGTHTGRTEILKGKHRENCKTHAQGDFKSYRENTGKTSVPGELKSYREKTGKPMHREN